MGGLENLPQRATPDSSPLLNCRICAYFLYAEHSELNCRLAERCRPEVIRMNFLWEVGLNRARGEAVSSSVVVRAALKDRGNFHTYITVRRMCASRFCLFFGKAQRLHVPFSSLAHTHDTFKTRASLQKHSTLVLLGSQCADSDLPSDNKSST